MLRPHSLSTTIYRHLAGPLCFLLIFAATASAASRDKRPITKPKYDPDAPKVGLFEGIEQDVLGVQVILKDSTGGNVIFENKTDEVLTVELPEAVVGVQVLPQGFGDELGLGTDTGGGGNSGGQNQQAGGGFGGGGLGGGGFGGGGLGGGGFFSIPPERKVRIPINTVCLEHGKKEPHPRVNYKLVPVTEVSDDPTLHELLKLVGTGKLDQQSAQAAAWHLANEMSWDELAAKKFERVRAPDTPYFSRAQLFTAQNIVSTSKQLAEQEEDEPAAPRRSRDRVSAR